MALDGRPAQGAGMETTIDRGIRLCGAFAAVTIVPGVGHGASAR